MICEVQLKRDFDQSACQHTCQFIDEILKTCDTNRDRFQLFEIYAVALGEYVQAGAFVKSVVADDNLDLAESQQNAEEASQLVDEELQQTDSGSHTLKQYKDKTMSYTEAADKIKALDMVSENPEFEKASLSYDLDNLYLRKTQDLFKAYLATGEDPSEKIKEEIHLGEQPETFKLLTFLEAASSMDQYISDKIDEDTCKKQIGEVIKDKNHFNFYMKKKKAYELL